MSAFGFNTGPNISSASLSSSVFGNANLGGQFPNGFGGVDVCIINDRNHCTGGASGGLTPGAPNNPIPEPGSIAMFLIGGVIVAGVARKQVLTPRR